GKAIEIAGGVGVIAEVDPSRIRTRHEQGWVGRVSQNLDEVFGIAKSFIKKIHPVSIAYIGNVVDLLEYIVKKGINVDLLSDQTSCHAPYDGGYCPQGISFEERTRLLETDRVRFKTLVDRSLKRHFELIKALVGRGTYFFDYGNSFMKAVYDAGRVKTALKFNDMVRNRAVGPIMLGRDHHDTGGTDSPFRETSNIKDGSNVMADMATQCFAGNAARGMTMVSLHNGGGVGIGKAINGGFGLLLDGREETDEIIKTASMWDVMGGVARRAWARNENSIRTCGEYNIENRGTDHITIPFLADEDLVKKTVSGALKTGKTQ
ncbi:hypothetical protein LCGC14_3106950, partial [marine sediment metagenome]